MDVTLRPVVAEDLPLLQRFAVEPWLIGLDWNGYRDPQAPVRRYAEDGFLGKDDGRLMVRTRAESSEPGVAGSGVAGSGVAGSGVAGSGVAGSGVAGSGVAGSGVAGSGVAGSGVAGSGVAGSGVAGSGVAGSGVAGSGVAGSGVAGSGVAGSGVAGSGAAGSEVAGAGVARAEVARLDTAGAEVARLDAAGAEAVGFETVGFVSWRAGSFDGRTPYWEIGIALLPEYRGRGIGWRAQAVLTTYLFEHTPVQRIQAATHPENIAEQKALEKAGFRLEGVIRGCEFRAGKLRDGYLYSRLRDDPEPELGNGSVTGAR